MNLFRTHLSRDTMVSGPVVQKTFVRATYCSSSYLYRSIDDKKAISFYFNVFNLID